LKAVGLWKNSFGTYTAVRFDSSLVSRKELEKQVTGQIQPLSLGFTVNPLRDESLSAAAGGVDFSQLFGGLSFFVIVAALILTILLVVLKLEGRKDQVRILISTGIPDRVIMKILHYENLILSLCGALLGAGLAILYTRLVFNALNGVWSDIVRTEMMQLTINAVTLVKGFVISTLIAWLTLFLFMHRFLKGERKKIKSPGAESTGNAKKKYRLVISLVAGIASIGLLISQVIRMENINAGIFFMAGGLLLLSLLLLFDYLMAGLDSKVFTEMDLLTLSLKNSLRNKNRSVTIVILLAIGTFVIISTGAYRKDVYTKSNDRTAGTGGFLFFGETTIPFIRDLNDPEVRQELGLTESVRFVQFSREEGDDAS